MVAPAYPSTLYIGGGQHLPPLFPSSRVHEDELEGVRKGEDRKHDTVGRMKSERFIQKVFRRRYRLTTQSAGVPPLPTLFTFRRGSAIATRRSTTLYSGFCTHTKAAGSPQVSIP
jgi:hypothetical protein